MDCEVVKKADFSSVRYAQCWEDADVLLQALDIQPDHTCLSIASAGDNTLAMLSRRPERVIALDLSPAQMACLELRVAAYRELSHPELLELMGSRASDCREVLYRRCRRLLPPGARRYWDAHTGEVRQGIGSAGRFERYLALFRQRILPLAHSRERIARLLQESTPLQRQVFYGQQWDNWRWRCLFRLFFSRLVMGRWGRDTSFFRYSEGDVARGILERTRYALTALNPSQNPYVQWILTGRHLTALPYSLRPENFEPIRQSLDRLERRCQPLEEFLDSAKRQAIDRYNLSDIFEYVSPNHYHRLLERLIDAGRPGGRLAYWNLVVPRSRPESMAGKLRPLPELAQTLHRDDKAFFYSALVVEEILE